MFKLLKKFEMKCRGYPFAYNDNFISNGIFLIDKSLVKDAEKYCCPESKDIQPSLDQVINGLPNLDEANVFEITDEFFITPIGKAIVFKSKNETVHISETYVKHFKLKKLYGNEPYSPFFTENKKIIIMPMRKN